MAVATVPNVGPPPSTTAGAPLKPPTNGAQDAAPPGGACRRAWSPVTGVTSSKLRPDHNRHRRGGGAPTSSTAAHTCTPAANTGSPAHHRPTRAARANTAWRTGPASRAPRVDSGRIMATRPPGRGQRAPGEQEQRGRVRVGRDRRPGQGLQPEVVGRRPGGVGVERAEEGRVADHHVEAVGWRIGPRLGTDRQRVGHHQVNGLHVGAILRAPRPQRGAGHLDGTRVDVGPPQQIGQDQPTRVAGLGQAAGRSQEEGGAPHRRVADRGRRRRPERTGR